MLDFRHVWRCPDGHEVSIRPGPQSPKNETERQAVELCWRTVARGCQLELTAGKICGKPVRYVVP